MARLLLKASNMASSNFEKGMFLVACIIAIGGAAGAVWIDQHHGRISAEALTIGEAPLAKLPRRTEQTAAEIGQIKTEPVTSNSQNQRAIFDPKTQQAQTFSPGMHTSIIGGQSYILPDVTHPPQDVQSQQPSENQPIGHRHGEEFQILKDSPQAITTPEGTHHISIHDFGLETIAVSIDHEQARRISKAHGSDNTGDNRVLIWSNGSVAYYHVNSPRARDNHAIIYVEYLR